MRNDQTRAPDPAACMADSPSDNAERVLAQLESLPTLAPVALRLLQLTGQENADLRDVVRLIEADAPLAARLVGLASRAQIATRAAHPTLERAVVLLGFKRLRQVVLAAKIVEVFASPDRATSFDRRGFWTHSLAVACAARFLAPRRTPPCDPDEAFLAALLHDLGKIALATCLPRSYERVVEHAERRRGDLLAIERDIIGTDHAVAGRRVAQRWRLPESLVLPIWLHHLPPDALPDAARSAGLTGLTWLADQIVRQQRLGYSGNYASLHSSDEAAALAGIPASAVAEVMAALPTELETHAAWAGLDDLHAGRLYAEALARSSQELAELRQEAQRDADVPAAGQAAALADLFGQVGPHTSETQAAAHSARVVSEWVGAAPTVVFALSASGRIAYGAHAPGASRQALGSLAARPDELDEAVEFAAPRAARGPQPDAALIHPAGTVLARWATGVLGPIESAAAATTAGGPADSRAATHDPARSIRHGPAARSDGPPPLWLLPIRDRERLIGAAVFVASAERVAALQRAADAGMLCMALRAALEMAAALARSRELEEQLVAAQCRLAAVQQEVSAARGLRMTAEMAAGAAHELNNPLTVISGRAQLLKARLDNPTDVQCLAAILDAAHRASEIITDLMRFSEPVVAAPQALALQVLLPALAAELRGELADRRLLLNLPPDLPAVRCDPKHLRSTIVELIRNAVDATSAATGIIEVKAEGSPSDENVRLMIIDNGRGVDARAREQAFAPFFSAQPAGRKRGLGLSRAMRWMQANNASITLAPHAAGGAVATILLAREGTARSA